LLFLLLLAGCSAASLAVEQPPQPSQVPSVSQSIVPTESITGTPDIETQEKAILDQIHILASNYQQAVESEKQNGNAIVAKDPKTGEETLTFTGNSLDKINGLDLTVIQQITQLNQEYLGLFQKNYQTTPYPTQSSPDTSQVYLNNLMQEFNTWEISESKTGSVVVVYNPANSKFQPMLVGDSYARDTLDWQAIRQLQVDIIAEPLSERLPEIRAIQKIDPGDVTLVFVARTPYRMDIQLYHYASATWYVDVYTATHDIIEMELKDQAFVLPVGQILSKSELEQKARDIIANIAPSINLAGLTPNPEEKSSGDQANYFFRWEDIMKPLLDNGQSPFIQVGLTQNGDMVGYVNTLPLSR
jgi:hypothetical protein